MIAFVVWLATAIVLLAMLVSAYTQLALAVPTRVSPFESLGPLVSAETSALRSHCAGNASRTAASIVRASLPSDGIETREPLRVATRFDIEHIAERSDELRPPELTQRQRPCSPERRTASFATGYS